MNGRRNWGAEFYVEEVVCEDDPMRGIPHTELEPLVKERWGVEDLLKETKPRWPITEGRYWPVYRDMTNCEKDGSF